jgi:hypothetical protein
MADNEDHAPSPEKTLEWLEAKALRCCRGRPWCGHLKAVRIERTTLSGNEANWDVVAFEPQLSPAAENEAMKEIHLLREAYALAPK